MWPSSSFVTAERLEISHQSQTCSSGTSNNAFMTTEVGTGKTVGDIKRDVRASQQTLRQGHTVHKAKSLAVIPGRRVTLASL